MLLFRPSSHHSEENPIQYDGLDHLVKNVRKASVFSPCIQSLSHQCASAIDDISLKMLNGAYLNSLVLYYFDLEEWKLPDFKNLVVNSEVEEIRKNMLFISL